MQHSEQQDSGKASERSVMVNFIDTIFLDRLPRQLHLGVCIRSFGVKPAWEEVWEQRFDRYGYAFITQGNGHLFENGKKWLVRAPCMLHQVPGRVYKMAPNPVWDEFYITFSESYRPNWEHSPWAFLRRPVVFIEHAEFMLEHLQSMMGLIKQITRPGMADRFDLAAYDLLLDVLQFGRFQPRIGENNLVSRVAQYLEAHYLENISLEKLAAKFGVSPRHLRRLWHKEYEQSPSEFVVERQIEQAQYLLEFTQMRIGEIADLLHMNDPNYFTRKFTRQTGFSPTQYRRQKERVPRQQY